MISQKKMVLIIDVFCFEKSDIALAAGVMDCGGLLLFDEKQHIGCKTPLQKF